MDKFEKLIYNTMCGLGFLANSYLERPETDKIDNQYTETVRAIFLPPKELGYTIDGVAKYEAKVSEAKCLENRKDDFTFIGWTVCAETSIEYYKDKDSNLYQFLYAWYKPKKGTLNKTMTGVFVLKEKEVITS